MTYVVDRRRSLETPRMRNSDHFNLKTVPIGVALIHFSTFSFIHGHGLMPVKAKI